MMAAQSLVVHGGVAGGEGGRAAEAASLIRLRHDARAPVRLLLGTDADDLSVLESGDDALGRFLFRPRLSALSSLGDM